MSGPSAASRVAAGVAPSLFSLSAMADLTSTREPATCSNAGRESLLSWDTCFPSSTLPSGLIPSTLRLTLFGPQSSSLSSGNEAQISVGGPSLNDTLLITAAAGAVGAELAAGFALFAGAQSLLPRRSEAPFSKKRRDVRERLGLIWTEGGSGGGSGGNGGGGGLGLLTESDLAAAVATDAALLFLFFLSFLASALPRVDSADLSLLRCCCDFFSFFRVLGGPAESVAVSSAVASALSRLSLSDF